MSNVYMKFSGRNITIITAAKLINKTPAYVRNGILLGFFPVGAAFYSMGTTKYDYYISPLLFWEYTGIIPNKDAMELESYPVFTQGSISVEEASKIMGKNKEFVRNGLIQSRLPFGSAIKQEDSSRYQFYISPKKFWEYTGYVA